MATGSSTPPKRRTSLATSPVPPKASKMSASAPVFNPSKPLLSKSENHGNRYDPESSNALSRVTRPLLNSRRPGAAANLVPHQATVPKTGEAKENTRRLIVVLAQVWGSHQLVSLHMCILILVLRRHAWKHTGCRRDQEGRTQQGKKPNMHYSIVTIIKASSPKQVGISQMPGPISHIKWIISQHSGHSYS